MELGREERETPRGGHSQMCAAQAAEAAAAAWAGAATVFPEVVQLNVGGTHFATLLSTLRSCEGSMLAAMFSGRHRLPRDHVGRFFIDRDPAYFGDILNFLRSGEVPCHERARGVHREAHYFGLQPLLACLETLQPLAGERVRQAFLDLLPYYNENLERMITVSRERAAQRRARFAKLRVCVYKEELPATPYERPLFGGRLALERPPMALNLEGAAMAQGPGAGADVGSAGRAAFRHSCDVDVTFGPWQAVADVYDLLHCVVSDLAARGISAEHQCIGVCDKHLVSHYYCKRPVYEFKILWW
ncbi:BTB/POZ domain-containing protein KCTD7 isoform X1 [Lethenteron reissneri]|uniref:BTB/POZ domain-containing protein KCTD7 isoform X1 n=2 Tax=Lethenteron reissneri TaxID=7753 RepID=UPI002AB79585|nr:BTB/POZ domain-containing protein KCTD7 isoform X1 [Lethenteron reissneri]